MKNNKTGWTSFLRHHGPAFLSWLEQNQVLHEKFELLSVSLWKLIQSEVNTSESAYSVWASVSAVISRCNDQSTYSMNGAAVAYAWLHLLDRYVRTWVALKYLVKTGFLPFAKHGVNVLDIGTGPGPSAFAIHDFYSSMAKFADLTNNVKWKQLPDITCVEFEKSTNSFRHHLAEFIFQEDKYHSKSILAMCSYLSDFGSLEPRVERQNLQRELRWSEDIYFDEAANEWTSELQYSADEANDIAQSLHRYRLIVFSNFLTAVGNVKNFESNLVDIFSDAQPGTVILVIGGKGGAFPEIYCFVNDLAKSAGFELKISEQQVSSVNTAVSDLVFNEGVKIYEYLLSLAPNGPDLTHETQMIQDHFTRTRKATPSSQLWVYRKYKW